MALSFPWSEAHLLGGRFHSFLSSTGHSHARLNDSRRGRFRNLGLSSSSSRMWASRSVPCQATAPARSQVGGYSSSPPAAHPAQGPSLRGNAFPPALTTIPCVGTVWFLCIYLTFYFETLSNLQTTWKKSTKNHLFRRTAMT